MSDVFKTQFVSTFIRETPAESFKLFDKTLSKEPKSFEHGEFLLTVGSTEVVVAANVNAFVFYSDLPVKLKIGTTLELNDIEQFSYYGPITSFSVINQSTSKDAKIYFAASATK